MLVGTVAGAPKTKTEVSKNETATEQQQKKRFIGMTVNFIRKNFGEWSGKQSDSDLTKFIENMIEFAEKHDVLSGPSIQKLIAYKIIYDFSIPLPPHLRFILKRPGLDEYARLQYFERQFEDMSPLIKLQLEDNLERLP